MAVAAGEFGRSALEGSVTIARFGKIVPSQGDILSLIGYRLTMAEATAALPDAERLTNMRQGRDRLRKRTGQDFGYDVAAWHTFLLAHPKYVYDHPYAFDGVRSALEESITDPHRLRLVALLEANPARYSEIAVENPSELPPLAAGEIRGHAWRVIPSGSEYVPSFLSGELAGREKSLAITKEQYLGLASGAVSITSIEYKYGIG